MLVCVPVLISGIRGKKWLRAIITSVLIALFVLLVASFIYRSQMASSPEWVYKQAFGEYPSEDVSVLESDYRFGTDYAAMVLKFKTDDPNRILASHAELKPVTQQDFRTQLFSRQLPEWFKPLEYLPSRFYRACPYRDMYSRSEALLSYNFESGTAFFSYDAFE